MTGYPIEEAARIASSALVTAVPGGWGIPRFAEIAQIIPDLLQYQLFLHLIR